jgi:hypothetical protein
MRRPALERSLNIREITFLERASSSNFRDRRKLLRWPVSRYGGIARGLLRGINGMIDSIISTAEIRVGAY